MKFKKAFKDSRLNDFKEKGYSTFSSILLPEDVSKLAVLCRQIYETIDKDDPSYHSGGVDGVNQLIIHNIKTATFLNKIFSNSNIMSFLEEVNGQNYKILDISFRRSMAGDSGLGLHQDGPGEVNMCICLDNNPNGDGATAIWPSSHLLEKSAKKLHLEVHPIFINTFRFLFKPLSIKAGDVCFFSNRVWHGRFSNKSKLNHDVLFVGFFPSGYSYANQAWPDKLIKLDCPKELGRLLGSSKDLKASVLACGCEARESNNIYYDTDHGYSIQIEDSKYLSQIPKPLKLHFSMIFIKLIWGLSRFLYRPFKIIKCLKKN